MVAAVSGCVVVSITFLSRFRMSKKPSLSLGIGFRRYLSTIGSAAGASERALGEVGYSLDSSKYESQVPIVAISSATSNADVDYSLDSSKYVSQVPIVAISSATSNADATDNADTNAVDAAACSALDEALQSALFVSPAFQEKRLAFREAARRRSVAVVTDFDHTLTAPWSTQCHDVLVRNEAL